MTAETINKNINRLYQFYNVDEGARSSFEGNFDAKVLLQEYSRILDQFGAPKFGLSLLYLTPAEYEEMEKLMKVDWLPAVTIYNGFVKIKDQLPDIFGFLYARRTWHIQKINA